MKPVDLPSHTNSTCASVSLRSWLPLAHGEHGEDLGSELTSALQTGNPRDTSPLISIAQKA